MLCTYILYSPFHGYQYFAALPLIFIRGNDKHSNKTPQSAALSNICRILCIKTAQFTKSNFVPSIGNKRQRRETFVGDEFNQPGITPSIEIPRSASPRNICETVPSKPLNSPNPIHSINREQAAAPQNICSQ